MNLFADSWVMQFLNNNSAVKLDLKKKIEIMQADEFKKCIK